MGKAAPQEHLVGETEGTCGVTLVALGRKAESRGGIGDLGKGLGRSCGGLGSEGGLGRSCGVA